MFRSFLLRLFSQTSFFFLLGLSICSGAMAQQNYSSQSILQKAVNSLGTSLTSIKTPNLPQKQWIDQMEFRTEFNELDLVQQEYTFRMRFKNDKLRQQQNKLFEMQLNQIANESRLSRDDQAAAYYEGIVDWYFVQKKQPLYSKKVKLIEDKNKLEMALFRDDENLNFNDVLKVNDRLKEIKTDLYALTNDRLNIFTQFSIKDTSAVLSDGNWIGVEQIKNVIAKIDMAFDSHPDLGIQKDRIALLNQEYVVEQNDVDNIFDFAQIKYKIDDELPIQRELSFGVSIVIPYKQVDQASLTKIEIEKLEEQIKQNDIIQSLQSELNAERTELMQLIDKHSFLKNLFVEENLELLKKEYLASDQLAPVPLLNLELMIIDRKIELLEVEEEIYQQYINTLDNIDALRLENNVNYLDQNLAPIR